MQPAVRYRRNFSLPPRKIPACLHSDSTWRQIGESGLHLATRPFLPPNDGTALILANDVERVLTDIDVDYGGRSVEFL
jgi:hypothetical protein